MYMKDDILMMRWKNIFTYSFLSFIMRALPVKTKNKEINYQRIGVWKKKNYVKHKWQAWVQIIACCNECRIKFHIKLRPIVKKGGACKFKVWKKNFETEDIPQIENFTSAQILVYVIKNTSGFFKLNPTSYVALRVMRFLVEYFNGSSFTET